LPKKPFPIVSLFSGAGGLDLGFQDSGFKTILAIDTDRSACVTLENNFSGVRVLKQSLSDVSDDYLLERLAELPQKATPVGVIGGPPCQSFSISNVFKRPGQPRSRLPEKYAYLLRALNKEYELDFFLFENVPGLRHKQHADLFAYFKELFEQAGFSIFEDELDAQKFGVAQVRKRVFLVGFNRRKYPGLEFEFPEASRAKRRTVRNLIEKLPKPIYFEHGLAPEDIPFHSNHWCMKPKSKKFFNGFLKQGHMKGRPFRVLEWDKPSWTVAYGHREVHIHPSGRRRLSVYEAMLLQGFPCDYRLYGTLSDQIRLVSDAVPPPLAQGLAEAIADVLENGRQTTKGRRIQGALFPSHSQTRT
jgi:DNA (cytosine-5)-methyltransferase 1